MARVDTEKDLIQETKSARTGCGETRVMVRKGGLEPPRLTAPDPKSGASANSATFARAAANSLLLISQRSSKRERVHRYSSAEYGCTCACSIFTIAQANAAVTAVTAVATGVSHRQQHRV